MSAAITVTPVATPTGILTWAKIAEMINGIILTINDGSIPSSALIGVTVDKLLTGNLGTTILFKSANYAVDAGGLATSGWALKGDGSFDSPGLKLRPDGTVIIGTGSYKLTIDPTGDFVWGAGGASVRITHEGSLIIGGEDIDAPFIVQPSGRLIARFQPDAIDGVDIGQVTGLVGPPVISPDGGTFDTTLTVTLTRRTAWSDMYYTTDGSTPDTSKTLYTAPFVISATVTVKAIAYKFGLASSVSSKTFTEDGGAVVSNPRFDPMPTSTPFSPTGGGQPVEISCPTAGATIRYTTDGTTPSSTVGTIIATGGTVTLTTGTTTLKAIAYKGGLGDSDVVSADYVVTSGGTGTGDQVADPEFTQTGGTLGISTITGTLACTTPGATIEKRLWNGSEYTTGFTTYTAPVSIPVNWFLEFRAYKAGLLTSNIITEYNY